MIFGPFPCPTADQLRDALRRIAHRHPDHRLFSAVERTRFGARWVQRSPAEIDELCAAMVTELPSEIGDDTDALLRRVAMPLDPGLMVRYVVTDRYIGSTRTHLLGDTAFAGITPMIVGVAMGEPVPDLPAEERHSMPLTRAALHYFGRHPGRLRAALQAPRPRPRKRAPLVRVPGDWSIASVGRTATAETVEAVRYWRDAECPSASIANTWAAAIHQAFIDAGVTFATSGFHMLVNARRYLPETATGGTNFAASVYVEPDNPGDPAAIEAVARRNLDSGRPLLSMAASALTMPWRSRAIGARPDVLAHAAPTLTVSYVGRWMPFEPLAVLPDAVVQYSAVRPDGPDGLTVLCSSSHGRLSISGCFCEAVVPRSAVEDALDRLVADPVALLRAGTHDLSGRL
jgi:hypothetical protein